MHNVSDELTFVAFFFFGGAAVFRCDNPSWGGTSLDGRSPQPQQGGGGLSCKLGAFQSEGEGGAANKHP